MLRRPPRSTRTDTLFPYTTLFRSFGTPSVAEEAVKSGHLDLAMIGRAHLANPNWSYLAAQELGVERASWTLPAPYAHRSEEHTSELQSLMRISYAVFCLKKKNTKKDRYHTITEQIQKNTNTT